MTLAEKYGPWAIVTGASDGIGKAFAREIGKAGINMILVSRRTHLLDALAEEIRLTSGAQSFVLSADLSGRQGVDSVIRASELYDVGLLVSAAGFGTSGPFLEARLSDEREMLETNCYATLALSQALGRRMAERRRGGLILFSSLVGWQGTPFAAHYAATKAYIQTFAEGIRSELKAHGVDVIAVAPGPVASGFGERAKMRLSATVKPETVAQKTLSALGRSGTIVPGGLSKLLTYSLLPLPRIMRTLIMGRIMSGMTRNFSFLK